MDWPLGQDRFIPCRLLVASRLRVIKAPAQINKQFVLDFPPKKWRKETERKRITPDAINQMLTTR